MSFAYNVGIGNLQKAPCSGSTRQVTLPAPQTSLRKWNKAGGKVMNGLTRRRAAEAALYRS